MSVSMRDLDPAFQGAGQKAYPSPSNPLLKSYYVLLISNYFVFFCLYPYEILLDG